MRGAQGDAAAQNDTASSTSYAGEKPRSTSLAKRHRIAWHCSRFWMRYLIIFIIFLAILLPIFFKIVIPAIVQGVVNDQDLPILGGRIDCLPSLQLKLALNTSLNTPVPSRIADFTLYLYNKATKPYSPFANLTVSGQKLKGNTKIAVQEQIITLTNEGEAVNWFGHIFDEDKSDLVVRGNPTIYLDQLKSDTYLDKTLKLPGLRKFVGFGIKDLKVILPPKENGNNIKGTVNIPNWGVLILSLGNITFNLLSGDSTIGHIIVYDVLLNVGNNTRNFEGQLDLDSVMGNTLPVLASQTDASNSGQIEFNLTGNSTIVNGQHVRYIEKVLNSRNLTTSMSFDTIVRGAFRRHLGGELP